jgi:hypothetical protein
MHHAASALLAGRESIACGKKPSRRSAAFDAALGRTYDGAVILAQHRQ